MSQTFDVEVDGLADQTRHFVSSFADSNPTWKVGDMGHQLFSRCSTTSNQRPFFEMFVTSTPKALLPRPTDFIFMLLDETQGLRRRAIAQTVVDGQFELRLEPELRFPTGPEEEAKPGRPEDRGALAGSLPLRRGHCSVQETIPLDNREKMPSTYSRSSRGVSQDTEGR